MGAGVGVAAGPRSEFRACEVRREVLRIQVGGFQAVRLAGQYGELRIPLQGTAGFDGHTVAVEGAAGLTGDPPFRGMASRVARRRHLVERAKLVRMVWGSAVVVSAGAVPARLITDEDEIAFRGDCVSLPELLRNLVGAAEVEVDADGEVAGFDEPARCLVPVFGTRWLEGEVTSADGFSARDPGRRPWTGTTIPGEPVTGRSLVGCRGAERDTVRGAISSFAVA